MSPKVFAHLLAGCGEIADLQVIPRPSMAAGAGLILARRRLLMFWSSKREAGGRAGRVGFSANRRIIFRREVDPTGVSRIASGLGSLDR
jgi:hypothetical protein